MEKQEKLIENIIHFKCTQIEEGMSYECISQQPYKDTVLQNMVFPFCFPEGESMINKKDGLNYHIDYEKQESFAFILTDISANRRYVYCRRFSNFKFPECFCIIAERPFESLFKKILDKAVAIRKISINLLSKFFEDIAKQNVPSINGVLTNISFHHIPYEISSEEDFSKHHSSNVLNILKLFGASFLVDIIGDIMMERKFVFLSNSIGSLSDTILTLTSLIYPFVWHHVLIPILPVQLASYPTAPMPYLIGIKTSLWEHVKKECDGGMEDTIVIDLEKGQQIEGPVFPMVFTSPNSILLRSQLSLIQNDPDPDENIELKNDTIYNMFQLFFFKIFHNYFQCFKANPGGKIKYSFDRDTFVSKLNEDDKLFFESFEDSQMCFMFFNTRAEQKSDEYQIETLCPFNRLPPKESYGFVDCGFVMENLDSGESISMVCRFCNLLITGEDPCSQRGNELYHTKCFRCCCCAKILEGNKLANCERLKCVYCHRSQKPELTVNEIQARIDSKEKRKLTKTEKLVSKTFKKRFENEKLQQN
ncbi:DENN domain-containing protein 2D, putative [Entamoeba dispar SAW760]|uniref:DENN domain-containing protein 2D, putative n=1 Tax=Entamoeba dispar (strain ATCC PRA-260 / SAW760) TaxID=370354 RepID=B0E6H6_ENTDS|nr:DENN domain-containing protein 2D, putative [Entamoeba dispar SAW760]EDR29871.1 DENN domain-containing protein 2D, putative [Entamoeba dispar SAW760]|eukprot:EDR29871.1 DENN domain-containing protein 2D, putative [Entamoeba dispar SAW760]